MTSPVLINQQSLSGAIRQFSFWVANETVDLPNCAGISYVSELKQEPSALEMIYAIFVNNLKFDEQGMVINTKYAEHRAGVFIREYFGEQEVASPPPDDNQFNPDERELY